MTTLPFSIISGRFLGGSRGGLVCVAGSGSRGRSSAQVLQLLDEEGQGQGGAAEGGCGAKLSCASVGYANFPGQCSAMELCGLSTSAKSFMAIATCQDHGYEDLRSCSEIVLVDATLGSGYSDTPGILPHLTVFKDDSDEAVALNALAYDGYSGHLACVDATGFVRILDLGARQHQRDGGVSSFLVPGGGGRNSLLYSKSGKLYTAGSSPRGHINVWDARVPSSGPRSGLEGTSSSSSWYRSSLSVVIPELLWPPVHGETKVRYAEYISSMCIHGTQEEVVYCGISSGSVMQIDLRSGRAVQTVASHSSNNKVTSVMHCSVDSGSSSLLLSGSDAGDVLYSDLRRRGVEHEETSVESLLTGGRGNGSISSLDFAAEARCALACSATGGLWAFSLAQRRSNALLSLDFS